MRSVFWCAVGVFGYLTSIAKIEQDTGIGFFPELPEPTRTVVENDVEVRMW